MRRSYRETQSEKQKRYRGRNAVVLDSGGGRATLSDGINDQKKPETFARQILEPPGKCNAVQSMHNDAAANARQLIGKNG
jgi:hypothetical protein